MDKTNGNVPGPDRGPEPLAWGPGVEARIVALEAGLAKLKGEVKKATRRGAPGGAEKAAEDSRTPKPAAPEVPAAVDREKELPPGVEVAGDPSPLGSSDAASAPVA